MHKSLIIYHISNHKLQKIYNKVNKVPRVIFGLCPIFGINIQSLMINHIISYIFNYLFISKKVKGNINMYTSLDFYF